MYVNSVTEIPVAIFKLKCKLDSQMTIIYLYLQSMKYIMTIY